MIKGPILEIHLAQSNVDLTLHKLGSDLKLDVVFPFIIICSGAVLVSIF